MAGLTLNCTLINSQQSRVLVVGAHAPTLFPEVHSGICWQLESLCQLDPPALERQQKCCLASRPTPPTLERQS